MSFLMQKYNPEGRKIMKKEYYQLVFQKPMETTPTGKPLLLFVAYGEDTENEMGFVRINGIKNPLPFKEAYGIIPLHLESWLKSNGWKKVGHRDIQD